MTTAPATDPREGLTPAASLRIAFFGTPAFAVPTLDALLHSRHHVVAVVTQPDRPRGRGQRTSDAPVKACATAAGVPILQPDQLKDPAFVAAFDALRVDLGVVAAYGKILPEALIAAPRLGMINLHASLLPRHRGAAPVHRAIIAGDHETGVTIMRVVKALDAGPMLAKARRPIGPDETSSEVESDLATLGAALLVTVVDRLSDGSSEETPQDEAAATYAKRLLKEEGAIDWTLEAQQIHDLIRGLYPWPHAYTFLDGHRFILLRSSPLPDRRGMATPGTILEAGGDHLVVATRMGALDVRQIQAEGKRPMTAREFLAGHHLTPGRRFTAAP
ncbi:MAG: methionyl-tRNA formyltransferase [Vicinamibacterales bacterium]